MTHTTLSSDSSRTRRLALAGVFTALAIVGSFLSFPVAGSKCAPVQHIINILAAVTLGPWYSVGIAFCASLLRNLLGLGSMMAFPGSMVGALCCGLVYFHLPQAQPDLSCRGTRHQEFLAAWLLILLQYILWESLLPGSLSM